MVAQTKTIGTTVDFANSIELKNFKTYCFRDDLIGILAYQREPLTISGAARDALLGGNLQNVIDQTWGQGMQTEYCTITWNETAQNGNYLITDLRVGLVTKMVREYNVGPAYMLSALEAIPWLNPLLVAASMTFYDRWQAWRLLTFSRVEPLRFRKALDESISQIIWVGYPIGGTPPPLPDIAAIKSTILAQGDFNTALGKFTTEMVDKGYAVNYPTPDSYGIDVCLEQSNAGLPMPNNPYQRAYFYRVHVRFWWDFSTNPDFSIDEAAAGRLFVWTLPAIIAVIIAVGAIIAGSIVAYNLTHTKTEYVEFDYVRNADGSPYIDPATGNPVFYKSKEGSSEGPPDFWGWVIPIIALIGAAAVVYMLLPLRPRGRQNGNYEKE